MKCRMNFIMAVLFAACIALPAYSQDSPKECDDWEYYLIPYFWAPSIESDSTLSGFEGSVEFSFSDIMENMDLAAMGRVEAWNKNKWGLTFDGLFLNLGADKAFEISHSLATSKLDADIRLGKLDFGLAYRLVDVRARCSQQRFMFEPYGGLRYAYLRQIVTLRQDIPGIGLIGADVGDTQDWVEPFVGGRIRWDWNEKFALTLSGDAGGFGIGSASTLSWNIVPGFSYKISENSRFEAGYKIFDIDYSRGSGFNKFALDARANGPIFYLKIVY